MLPMVMSTEASTRLLSCIPSLVFFLRFSESESIYTHSKFMVKFRVVMGYLTSNCAALEIIYSTGQFILLPISHKKGSLMKS